MFGANSIEHDKSVETGIRAIKEFSALGFNVVAIYLDRNNDWYVKPVNPNTKDVRSASQLTIFTEKELQQPLGWQLQLNKKGQLWLELPGKLGFSRSIAIDLAFPVFHGLAGEDGTLQGSCDLMQVPFLGCDLTTTALALDKVLAKDVMMSFDLPTKPYVFFTKTEWESHKDSLLLAIKKTCNMPVFVKPARLGSSVGVSSANDKEMLVSAIDEVFTYDTKAIVEEAVQNPTQIIVSITGNYYRPDQINVSEPVTIDTDGGVMKPLHTSQKNIEEIKEIAKRTYVSFECTGIAQVDIIRNHDTGELSVIEIDTVPHNLSIPAWEASGIEADRLLRELVRLADEHHARN